MIGFHAEVLALLSDRPRNRPDILACFPPTVHPDAVHKALFELIRAGVANSTQLGISLAVREHDDDTQAHQHCKTTGKQGGVTRRKTRRPKNVPRYNAVGHRYCSRCECYLPLTKFKADPSVSDGYYHRCKCCHAEVRREKLAAKLESISHQNAPENSPQEPAGASPWGYPQATHSEMAGMWSSG